ncbi:MAG: type II toxin-antitoxin system HicB family antitoxin [Lactobacillales bacterium]|jgi:predicted RNase H-like HicB family nuclease|nr:type II toxin-antitoxin system HicB family antitoxin [Lactobacillales bacterium]
MLKTYPAIFHEDNGYWIEFPDFQNGATEGDNLEESMIMAKEFLASIIAYYIDNEMELPKPTDITTLNVSDGFTTLIQVDPSPFIRNNKTVRKNVTVPEWLVKLADKAQVNYSETLTNALEEKLNVR